MTSPGLPLTNEAHLRKVHAEVPLAEWLLIVLVAPPQEGDVQRTGRGCVPVGGFTAFFYEPADQEVHVHRRTRLRFPGSVILGFAAAVLADCIFLQRVLLYFAVRSLGGLVLAPGLFREVILHLPGLTGFMG